MDRVQWLERDVARLERALLKLAVLCGMKPRAVCRLLGWKQNHTSYRIIREVGE